MLFEPQINQTILKNRLLVGVVDCVKQDNKTTYLCMFTIDEFVSMSNSLLPMIFNNNLRPRLHQASVSTLR